MKKKLLTLVLGAAVVIAAAPSAFAALTNPQQAEVNKLQNEIANLRKQVVQKYVDSGQITAEQGKAMQQRIDAAVQSETTNGSVYGVPGFGGGQGGCGRSGANLGGGQGGCGGPGSGFGGGFGGGCGANAGAAPETPAPTSQSL